VVAVRRFIKGGSVAGFLLAALWAMITALRLDRGYQDSWLLEGIEAPLLALLVAYLIILSQTSDLRQITIFTSASAFLLFAVPALKYSETYISTVDNAVHLASIRTIALTGHIDPLTSYVNTPGFHAFAAILAQLSDLPSETWAKIIPAFLGSTIPLAFYVLCHRAMLPAKLARNIIVLSGGSVPLLYLLNGTSFTLPLFVFVIIIFFLRAADRDGTRHTGAYAVLLLLFVCAIVFWHPSTSFLMPLILIAAGIAAMLRRKGMPFLQHSGALISLGILFLTGALTYWIYEANYVWSHFVKNISLALHADLTPELVPQRLFYLNFTDQLLMGLFFHSRDAMLVAIAILGGLFLARSNRSERFKQFLRTYSLIWLMSLVLLAIIFVAGFGAQGYARFLQYVVVLAPVLAGYGIWQASVFIHKRVPLISQRTFTFIALILTLLIASIQLYPYQPAIPLYSKGLSPNEATPILWMHQANTTYQYHMLGFARKELPPEIQVIADYAGYHQMALFFGLDARLFLRLMNGARSTPAFLLLHWPGQPGAYFEQAEYRTPVALHSLRTYPGMATVYDNGGSFILYFPRDIHELPVLSEWK
jgi:hypothetical protein